MNKYIHKVNNYETDKMGVTHHSNYIRWMEEARIDFLNKIGFGYKKLEEDGIISPVIGVECEYKMPTTFDDSIEIDVGVEEFVYLIKNSAYIYTDSHHGVCFSMIYHKPFTPILNPWRGKARFTSLFKIFNMENLLVEEGEILGRLENIAAPDYEEIDRIMAKEKEESLAWLYGHLDQERSNDETPSKEDLFARYFNRVMRIEHPVK